MIFRSITMLTTTVVAMGMGWRISAPREGAQGTAEAPADAIVELNETVIGEDLGDTVVFALRILQPLPWETDRVLLAYTAMPTPEGLPRLGFSATLLSALEQQSAEADSQKPAPFTIDAGGRTWEVRPKGQLTWAEVETKADLDHLIK